MNIIIDLSINFIEAFLVFTFMSLFVEFNNLKFEHKLLIMFMWALLALGVDFLKFPALLRSILSVLVGLLSILTFTRTALLKTTKYYLLSVVVMLMLSEVLGIFICKQLLGMNIGQFEMNSADYWSAILVCDLIAMLFYLIVRTLLNQQRRMMTEYYHGAKSIEYIIILGLIYLSSSIVAALQMRKIIVLDDFGNKLSGTIILIFITYMAFFLKLLYDANRHLSIQYDWKIRENAYHQQLEQIKIYETHYEKMKSERHDFHHHLNCIHGLNEMKKYQELHEYIGQLTGNNIKIQVLFDCSNPYLAALLHYKYQEGLQKNINIQFDIHLVESLKIDPLDLSIIVGNALDNAIESCEEVDKNAYLKLELSTMKNQLRLNLENSCRTGVESKQSKKWMSSKKDSSNHGYGIQNMDYIVQKYDGLMKLKADNEKFSLQIYMNNI